MALNHGGDPLLRPMGSENFDQKRNFLKIWPKSKYFWKLDQNWNSEKYDKHWKFLRNFDQNRPVYSKIWLNRNFWKILTKIEIFRKFEQNRNWGNFDQDRNFWIIWLNRCFSKIRKNRNFSKIWPTSKIFENFDQNRNSSKFWLKTKFLKFWNFSLISTKIEIFSKILTKINFFSNFD